MGKQFDKLIGNLSKLKRKKNSDSLIDSELYSEYKIYIPYIIISLLILFLLIFLRPSFVLIKSIRKKKDKLSYYLLFKWWILSVFLISLLYYFYSVSK